MTRKEKQDLIMQRELEQIVGKNNNMENTFERKYYNGKEGRVVVEYPSINDTGYHPDTPLINIGGLSDGYHTFDELYEFRKMYNAVLFNEWGNPNTSRAYNNGKGMDGWEVVTGSLYNVHKSIKHYDGEDCFGGGWFIVSAMLPTGLISNHYKMEDWDLFQVPEVDKALFEFDGHTGADVLERLKALTK